MPALKSSRISRVTGSLEPISSRSPIYQSPVCRSPINRTPLCEHFIQNINQRVINSNQINNNNNNSHTTLIKLKSIMASTSSATTAPGLVPMSCDLLKCLVEKELLSRTTQEESDLNSRPLILDCRPFLIHSESHIMASISVHCPAILRRRTGTGGLPLKTIIPDVVIREKLVTGQFSPIILYEDGSDPVTIGSAAATESVALFVAKSIQEELGIRTIHLLQDGFESFSRLYPHLCTKGLLGQSSMGINPNLPGSSYYPFPGGSSSSLVRSPASGSLTWPLKSTPKGCPTPRTPKNSANSLSVESAALLSFGNDQNEPVEILPHLFLGSENHASCKPVLDKLGITALLNVSHTCPNHFEEFYTYKCIPVEDSGVEDISIYFQEAIDYIENVREKEGKVLVHCHAGISRSATICMAYLMATRKLRMEEAYEFVKTRRRVVSPNFNFMGQLLNFESRVFPSSASPAPTSSSSLSRPEDEEEDED